MKKIFTYALSLVALLTAVSAKAEVRTVSTKADFENFFFMERSNDQCDTIYVKYNSGIMALSNGKNMPNAGKIHIIGVDDETGIKSGLGWQWNLPLNTEADQLSIFFDNLIIECNGGNTASSKYLFQTKDTAYHYIDSLSIKNCEIRNYNRALFRVQPGEKSSGLKDAGDVNYFAIENCTFHTGYALNNPMSLFRMDMRVAEMTFRNNLFYDMGYVHSLVQFATMTDDAGRVDINFTFENNTFIATCSQSSLMIFNEFVGQMSEFHINNNLFLVPNWKDDYNHPGIADSVYEANPDTINRLSVNYIASIQYGQVECLNNVFSGYKAPKEALDAESEGRWLEADTLYYSFEDVDFGWNKYTDPQNDLFGLWSGEKIYTSGTEGSPIGALSCYTDQKQTIVNFKVIIEGSQSASVTIVPDQSKYLSGDEVTVTANCNGKLNTFKGWSNGKQELTQTITLEGDLELVANFEEIPYYAAWTFENVTGKDMNAPMLADYFEQDSVALHYATYKDGAYVDSTTAAFRTRINKMPTDIKPCVFLRSTLNQLDTIKKSDYAYFEVSKVEKDDAITCYIGTENYACQTTNFDYSIDNGATWKTFATGTIADSSVTNVWIPVTANIPEEIAGQKAMFRIQGDVNGGRTVGKDVYGLLNDTTTLANVLTNEFLYISELFYLHNVVNSIQPVVAGKNADDAIYDIYGRRMMDADILKPGFYIQGGKKFIVR